MFPREKKPGWAADGPGIADYWAPEVQRIGGRYLLCFSAREKDRSLAIGLATAPGPEGPFVPHDKPLLRGGVIDAHIFTGSDGRAFLFWKEDSNAVWPRLLAQMLARRPGLTDTLFQAGWDRRTAAFAARLWPWLEACEPMEQFFALQPLIEAVVENFAFVRDTLGWEEGADSAAALHAMRTPIFAQPLDPVTLELTGKPRIVLVNDLHWEGHLIEGPWLTECNGLHFLFYSGNDFSTAEYGIGVAVASSPLGPYRKMERPLLRSTISWSGPGHPSVAVGLDGQPQLFFHAFRPGHAGYKEFRALLTARLLFAGGGVEVSC